MTTSLNNQNCIENRKSFRRSHKEFLAKRLLRYLISSFVFPGAEDASKLK